MKFDVTIRTPNYSSREGARAKLIVLHTTESPDDPKGNQDLENIGNFFAKPSTQASSHTANNIRGNDARYVPDEYKAWTSCNLNPVSLNIEQIGYASYTRKQWMKDRHLQLKNTAIQIAYWSKKYGIPIQVGKVSGSACTRSGVLGHKDLGAAGCGHSDPGTGYPFKYVIILARLIYAEHFDNNPRKASKIRKKVNRMRKRYGLPKFAEPRG